MTIIVVPTTQCNLKCSYCFEPESQRVGENMPLNVDAMKRSLIDVWAGPYQGSDICLHGGEFTMTERDVLRELMDFIYGFKGNVNIVTNGSMIDDDLIEMFKKYSVSIGLSCDGPPSLNRFRGPDPSSDEVTDRYNVLLNETIRKLRRHNLPVSIMCILHKANADSYEKIVALAKWMDELAMMGIKGGRMNLMYGKPEQELTPRQAETAWIELYKHNKHQNLNWNPFVEMEKNLQGEKLSPCVYNHCDIFNTKTLSILPDGSVGNCDRTFSEGIYLRSYGDKPSGRYKALEQTDCLGCRYWTICGGSCPMEGIGDDWRRKTRFCDAIYALYSQIERDIRREGKTVALGAMVTPPQSAHGDDAHGDSGHGDNVHGDKGHGDSTHGDSGHGDMGHGDTTHGDQPHGDSSHEDAPFWKLNRETLRWDKDE